MAASTDQVRTALEQLAGALLADAERIAARSVARMQELLPSYAQVPAAALLPVTLSNTRNVLEAVRDRHADPRRAEDHFRTSGEIRVRQEITADEMLQAWRIGLEVMREEAPPVAERLGIADNVLLEFVESTRRWGDVGMRLSAAAHREAEMRELERLGAEQAALRRVATLVARGARPGEVFTAVAEEVAGLLPVTSAAIGRFEPTGRSLPSPPGAPPASPSQSGGVGRPRETTSLESSCQRVDRRALTTTLMPPARSAFTRA